MRPPRFWGNDPGALHILSRVLKPVEYCYAQSTINRMAKPARFTAQIPVICIDSLNISGTGKTAAIIALITDLQQRGKTPIVISHRDAADPVKVNPKVHSSMEVGDKAMLISAFGPVWVGRDKVATATKAEKTNADILIMDGGYYDPAMLRNLSIIVTDAAIGFGNGRSLPAGPLREPLSTGLERADLLLTIGPRKAQSRFQNIWGPHISLPHLKGHIAPLQTGMDWTGTRYMAFSGIRHPEAFFATLRSLNITLSGVEALENHQDYTPALLSRLERDAAAMGAQLVTTEKDAVRLPASFLRQVVTLPVRLEFNDRTPLSEVFKRVGIVD